MSEELKALLEEIAALRDEIAKLRAEHVFVVSPPAPMPWPWPHQPYIGSPRPNYPMLPTPTTPCAPPTWCGTSTSGKADPSIMCWNAEEGAR